MKGFILVGLFFVIGSHLSCAQVKSDTEITVKVLSFNIFHGETMKGDFNLDVIAEVIKKTDPDIVALQEVDYKSNRSQNYDLVTELGWRTQLSPLFARAMYHDGGEYGEGVLSKFTFLSTRNVSLPHLESSEPRAALEIVTILPSNDTIAFVATHFDHLEDEGDRVNQAKKINEVFSKNRYPTILAGDLNAIPGSNPIRILEQMWEGSYDKTNPLKTYPSDHPIKKIDYVMYYPRNRWRVIDKQIIQDVVASDHCAYLVTLELLPK